MARQRSGGQYDPALVACLLEEPTLCACFTSLTPWNDVLALEPGPRPVLVGAQVEAAVRAIADFTDLRTPFMSGHSTAVAELCVVAGRTLRLSDTERSALRQAAYIHDVGTAAISVSIWDTGSAHITWALPQVA